VSIYTNAITERVLLLRDAGAILRSHTCRALHHRNVAEHGHGVAMLALTLAQCSEGAPLPRAEVLAAALVHDLSEIATGDVPAPVKRNNPDLREVLNRISTDWERHYDLRFDLTRAEQDLLLWCDRVDFALYALEEVTMGNRFFIEYLQRILDWISTMPLPATYAAAASDLLVGLLRKAAPYLNPNQGEP
jgi:hypothetical protein